MKKMNVRELRKNLKAVLDADEATEIGDDYQLRAIVVPVSRVPRWGRDYTTSLDDAIQRAQGVVKRLKSLRAGGSY